MGFSISWLAVKDKGTEAVLDAYHLSHSGEFGFYAEDPVSGRGLPTGWFLLVMNQCDHRFISKDALVKLSEACQVVACSIEEHVMFCSCECWRDGRMLWRVEHDAQRAIDDLSVSGSPPADYEALAKNYVERQDRAGGKHAKVDFYFEIPLQLARALVGFKHDENELEEESFEIFKSRAKTVEPTDVPKSWWRIW